MRKLIWIGAIALNSAWLVVPASAQDTKAPTRANAIAATVNGQPIPEAAVQRALKRVPPAKQGEARPEILNFLIDNALMDQYLAGLQIAVEDAEVDAKFRQVVDEIKKEGGTIDKVLAELSLTEAEMRAQIANQLRWEKFTASQSTEKALRETFDGNHDMFDGSAVRARHILITPVSNEPKAIADARSRLLAFKKQVEDEAAAGVARLPAGSDDAEKEKARRRITDEAFAAVATKESACPSKEQGGDLGWFTRAGNMVEPFARAAFALKPYEMSDVVPTQFGVHLILLTDRRPGKEVKYDEVKDVVKEVFIDRLRDQVLSRLRPAAKISVGAESTP